MKTEEGHAAKSKAFAWRLFAAVLIPFVVESVYLFVSRQPSHHFTDASDWWMIAFSALIGAAFVLTLPLRPSFRFASLLVYIPVIGILLFFYDFLFLAVVFGEGL